MSNLTLADLQALAQSVGFPNPAQAAAVAMAESGGNPNAHGDTTIGSGSGSIGLWQIYLDAHPQYTAAELYDPTTNAKAAYAISSDGTNWGPWSTAWEDPVKRTGYFGPNAPASKYYKPMFPGFPPGMIFPIVALALGGAYLLRDYLGAAWNTAGKWLST